MGEDPREICQVVMYESVRRRFAAWLQDNTYLTMAPALEPDGGEVVDVPTWLVVPDPAYSWPASFSPADGPTT